MISNLQYVLLFTTIKEAKFLENILSENYSTGLHAVIVQSSTKQVKSEVGISPRTEQLRQTMSRVSTTSLNTKNKSEETHNSERLNKISAGSRSVRRLVLVKRPQP